MKLFDLYAGSLSGFAVHSGQHTDSSTCSWHRITWRMSSPRAYRSSGLRAAALPPPLLPLLCFAAALSIAHTGQAYPSAGSHQKRGTRVTRSTTTSCAERTGHERPVNRDSVGTSIAAS